MEQLGFGFITEFERFEADELNVFYLGSPEYEEKVQNKISYILSDGSKKVARPFEKVVKIRKRWFRDVPNNIHLKTILSIPYILRADDINVNIATQNEIEKKLLEKDGKTYVVACYRLWCEKVTYRNVIYADGFNIFINSCGWEGDEMHGIIKICSEGNTDSSVVHRVSITKELKINYPRIEFEHCNVPWKMSLDEFDRILQSEKQILWDLMVKLDIEIPKVK